MDIDVEPRRIVWGRTRCDWCVKEVADGLLDGRPICAGCIDLQADEWEAQAIIAGVLHVSLDDELRAEERPARLPLLLPRPVTIEVCPHCKRSEQMVDWLRANHWPKDCIICRWWR